MGEFLDSEKQKQAQFKATSPTISETAREDGYFATRFRPYCLPVSYSEENLFPDIRQTVRDYFRHAKIKWHQGHQDKPSNHLCDSQVCCVNFLFPFADKPHALKRLLVPIYPDIELEQMLPIENGQYVAHEWVGQVNYLGEDRSTRRNPSRGALFTSADAAVMFQRKDGKRQFVLIEWKYTESYSGGVGLAVGVSGLRRVKTYAHHIGLLDWKLDNTHFHTVELLYNSLFYEPFYQLMRQQLLAYYMEKARELRADIVSLLHIAPAHNLGFRRVTSPYLNSITPATHSAMDVWQKLAPSDRFKSISTEALFGHLSVNDLPDMATWLNYIHERYSWVRQPPPTVA